MFWGEGTEGTAGRTNKEEAGGCHEGKRESVGHIGERTVGCVPAAWYAHRRNGSDDCASRENHVNWSTDGLDDMNDERFDRWLDRGAWATRFGRLALHVAMDTGLLEKTRPRGLFELARAFLRGDTNPSTIFRYQAACQPNKVALVGKGQRWSYGLLDEQLDRIATGLTHLGVRPGDRVVVLSSNRPEMVMIPPAVARMGAASIAVSWRSTPEELAYVLGHSRPSAVFFQHDLYSVVETALSLAASDESTLSRDRLIALGGVAPGYQSFDGWAASFPAKRVEGPGGAVIAYTSGTTGTPKAAVRTFSTSALEAGLGWISGAPFATDDVHLVVLPLYHSTAFAFVNLMHLVGATVVLLDRFAPEEFLRTVSERGVTHTAMVPTLLHRLVEVPSERRNQWDLSSLRTVVTAGAPLTGALARRFMNAFGHVLWNYYGSTETGLNTVAGPEDLLFSPGTIGHPLPGNELRILDEYGRPVKRGEVGELFVRAGLTILGYHGDVEATKRAQRDGFFSVGDLARQDDRGCYHIVGRKKDMIISGGVNVFPAEVEHVLSNHPAVAEAAVVGTPDEEWGERVVAFIVPRKGVHVDERELEQLCRHKLSGPKRPRQYRFVEQLPRNATGKVLKRQLRLELRSSASTP